MISLCIKRSKVTSFFVLIMFAGSTYALPGGVLLVGDSWAEQQWDDQSHALVFDTLGFGQVPVFGAATVESGSTAAAWATPAKLQQISDALGAEPDIDIVQLTVGGNDFLDGWRADMDPVAEAALRAQIRADLDTITSHILDVRPDIEILLSFYDYPNFVDTLGGPIGLLFCTPLWNDMAQPGPLELNSAAARVERSNAELARAHPRIFLVSHFGQMQSAFGFPDDGIPPGQIQPPGDPSLPSPTAALRSDGADCFHLRAAGYDVLVTNQFEGYFATRFDVIFRSSFR